MGGNAGIPHFAVHSRFLNKIFHINGYEEVEDRNGPHGHPSLYFWGFLNLKSYTNIHGNFCNLREQNEAETTPPAVLQNGRVEFNAGVDRCPVVCEKDVEHVP